jgi:hypothetical protein
LRALLLALTIALASPWIARAQSPVPMGDGPVRVEGELVLATALGLIPDGDASLSARRLSARAVARERAISMLHVWLDGLVGGGGLSPRLVRDLHAAIDASIDLRRIRSRVDGSAVIELAVPTRALAAVHCAAGLPWCG